MNHLEVCGRCFTLCFGRDGAVGAPLVAHLREACFMPGRRRRRRQGCGAGAVQHAKGDEVLEQTGANHLWRRPCGERCKLGSVTCFTPPFIS